MRVLLAAILVLVLSASEARAQRSPVLPSASSDEHIWVVTPRLESSPGWSLLHWGAPMERGTYHSGAPLVDLPRAVAAWDDRVWLMYEPAAGAAEPMREVVSRATAWDPMLKHFVPIPSNRFVVEPALAGSRPLLDATGTPDGPAVVLDRPLECWILRQGQWSALPRGPWGDDESLRLLWEGGPDGNLMAVSRSGAQSPGKLHRLKGDRSAWATEELQLPEGQLHRLLRVAGLPTAAIQTGESQIAVGYLRGGSWVRLGEFEHSSSAFAVVGEAAGATLIQFSSKKTLSLSGLDRVTGALTTPVPMQPSEITIGEWIHMPILGAITLLVLLAASVGDVTRRVPASLDALKLLPGDRKIVALLIDLAPAAGLSLLLLRADVDDLWSVPAWTGDWTRVRAYVLMTVIAVVHMTIGELWKGRSFGLWLMGGRVTTYDGGWPPAWAVLVRNLTRGIAILSPILLLVSLLNRRLQSLGDLLGRVVVVEERADDGGSATNADQP